MRGATCREYILARALPGVLSRGSVVAGTVEAGCRSASVPRRRAAKCVSGLHHFAGEQCVNESSPVDPSGRHYPSGLPLAIVARGSPSVG